MAPVCAAHFADTAWHGAVETVENVRLARDTYRLRIDCPRIARRIVPGQFVMLRLAGCNDPLLGRPLALYDTVLSTGGDAVGIDVVYLVVGKLTRRLAEIGRGTKLEVWGPLGNGFTPVPADHLIMVAGGIGQTPFPALAQEYLGRRMYGVGHAARLPDKRTRAACATLCYGARSAEYLAGVEDFRRLGAQVHVSTDDGSAGHHGLVTDVLRQVLDQSGAPPDGAHIACCGPEPMMEAVAHIAQDYGVSCQVSLETPMACGIGICFSCVAKVRQADDSWDYRRTCVEGPVFDAQQIVW
jgi:dihydroorotate dehydrogenase electron transfer subunit